MTKIFKTLTLTALAATILAGCGAPNSFLSGSSDSQFAARSGGAPWSLQTYFALDNDLDNGTGIVSGLHSMVQRSGRVAAVSFYDGEGKDDCFYAYQSTPGSAMQSVRIPEADSGTAAALDAFLTFAAQKTPAQRKALSMADHGGGIIRGICSDWNGPGGKKIIHVPEVAQVLRKRPVEIMLFDACFMNMVEVAYEIKDGAKFLLAAQTTTRGDFPYQNLVATMEKHAQGDSRTMAKAMLEDVAANARYTVAFGVMDTAATVPLAKEVSALSEAIIAKRKDARVKSAVQDAIRRTQAYAAESSAGLQMYNQYRDMGDLMQNLAQVPDPQISQAARAAATAVRASVVAEKHRNGFMDRLKLERISGAMIYAPVDSSVESKYLDRAWNKATRWGEAMAAVNGSGSWGPAVQKDKYPFAFPTRR